MSKLNIEMDIDPVLKFEMEEMAIRGGQAERFVLPSEQEAEDARIQELVERVKQQQQVDVHGMVKRFFQNITLPQLWAVATDNYIKKSTERLARKRIGRNYKRKIYA